MGRVRQPVGWVLAALLLLSACEVTWREPEVQPLNPVAIFPVEFAEACSALRATILALGTTLEENVIERDACLFESGYVDLTEQGVQINYLDKVAYVGPQALTRGRYLVTASVRPTATGNSRVRLTTRIEAYDGAYRMVRSRGLLERTLIERLGDLLDAEPIEE